jgi:hypothetical protein
MATNDDAGEKGSTDEDRYESDFIDDSAEGQCDNCEGKKCSACHPESAGEE